MTGDTIDDLIGKLKSDSAPARYSAANKLGKLGDGTAVPHLVSALGEETDEKVKDNIIFALGEIGDDSPAPVLIRMLTNDKSDRIRKCAAKALGMMKAPGAVDPLVKALKDSDFKVRKSAARALGQIGDARAIAALKASLKEDPDYTVTKYVEDALDRLSAT